MGAFWIAFAALLGVFLSKFIVRVMFGAGLSFLSYLGAQDFLDYLLDNIVGYYNLVSQEMLTVIGLLQVDTYISLVFSAYIFRAVGIVGLKLVRANFQTE